MMEQNALILPDNQGKSPAEMRKSILQLEAAMQAMPEHQIEIKTTHTFAPGLYMREIFIPKGTLLTGKIQKTEYLNIISQGDISVATEAGLKRTKAPAVIRSHPGLKRAGIAHEDTVWITVHQNPTNEWDIDKLEAMLFAETFDEVPAVMKADTEAPVVTWQGRSNVTPEGKVYFASPRTLDDVIKAVGTTREEMQRISENTEDQTHFPGSTEGVRIADSLIHGKGMFATKEFRAGRYIATARIGTKRTPAGRYTNHAAEPNAKMVPREYGDVDLVATRAIRAGEEIVIDYYITYLAMQSMTQRLEGGV